MQSQFMKRRILLIPGAMATMACCFSPTSLVAQQSAPPVTATASPYESTVTLSASQILQPAFLSGPLFKVREEVVTDWGVNTYAIDTTSYGTFLAHGNTLLAERIAEIGAMARLDNMSKGEEYGKAVKKAAKAPLHAAEEFIDDPVDTIKKVPKGIGKFIHRIGQNVKEAKEDRQRSDYEDDRVKSVLGVSQSKRNLCQQLGVNPYSSNEILQHKLDEMSWVLFAGGLTMTAATLPIDGGLGAVVKTTGALDRTSSLIYDQSPTDLRALNQKALQEMGVNEVDALAFLGCPAFSPWQQTQFVKALQSMPDVAGRQLFVQNATSASTEETDAIFYSETAQLLSQLHAAQWQIARIELQNNAPYCILRDGSVLLALHWDYARWSPAAEQCATWLQTLQVDGRKPAVTIALTGAASTLMRQEMEKRGFRLLDKQDKGPLN